MSKLYDHIVCNPPYFEDSLKSPDAGRSLARHTDQLSYEELFWSVSGLLSPKGRFSLIIPDRVLEKVLELGNQSGLHLTRHTRVFPTMKSTQPKRHLLEFSKIPEPLEQADLTIEVARHIYTDEYKALTKDFYL